MKFLSKNKFKRIYTDDKFTSIFNMKFNLKSNFTRCILGEIFDVVNQSYYRVSVSAEDIHAGVLTDLQYLKSSLEYVRDNIDAISDLEVEGSAFKLQVSRYEDEVYQLEIRMNIDKKAEFYHYLLDNSSENSRQKFLESMENDL